MLSPMNMSSSDSEINITVDNAVTVTPNSGRKYTSYLISVKTTNIAFSLHESRVRRRFSEFVWLRSWLSKYNKEIPVPDLPPKKYFGQQFQESVIEERCTGLQNFLRQVVTVTHYLSDSAVHLFLQTGLSVDDIAMTVEGKSGKTVLETIMEAGRSLSNLESSLDSGMASSSGSSDTPGQLDLSKCVSSLPHHMIFSPTRPDSPILSFIPGSADSLDAKDSPYNAVGGQQEQNYVNLDLNDSGNASNLSVEDNASTVKLSASETREGDEEQMRKVSYSAEVAQSVSSPNVQGELVQA